MLRDAVLLLPFTAFVAAIALPYWRSARASPAPLIERILCVSVLTLAQLALVGLLLGGAGWFTLPALLALNGTMTLGLIVLIARRAPAVGTAPGAPDDAYRGLRRFLVGLALLAGAGLAALGARLPPMAWDEVSYHLPMAALMLQRQSLFFGDFYLPLVDGYPKNVQIWFGTVLAFFRSDRWVDLAQVPFGALAVLATAAIARRLGSTASSAAVGGVLFLFTPLTLMQLRTAYIDVAHAALVLMSIALCLARVQGERHWTVRVGLAAALGLLAGVKLSSPLYVVVVVALYLVLGRSSVPRSERRTDLALMGAGFAALGAFFYAKNVLEHGNPFFPLVVKLAGRVLLDGETTVEDIVVNRPIGPLPVEVLRSWVAVGEASPSLWHGGLGLTWPALIPAVIASAAMAWRSRSRARLAVYGCMILMFLGTPLMWRTRFVLFLVGLGGVALAHVLDVARSSPRARRILAVGVGAVACVALAQAAWASRASLAWPPDVVPTAMGMYQPRPGIDESGGDPVERDRGIARWLAANLRDDDRVFGFVCRGRTRDLKPYALWTRTLSNTVEFPRVRDKADLESLGRREVGALFVAVRGCPAGEWLAGASGFDDIAVDRRLVLRRARP